MMHFSITNWTTQQYSTQRLRGYRERPALKNRGREPGIVGTVWGRVRAGQEKEKGMSTAHTCTTQAARDGAEMHNRKSGLADGHCIGVVELDLNASSKR